MRLLSALAGIALTVVLADTAMAQSINSALASAYNNNSLLNAQRAATRASDENLPQAKSGFRPTISANADISRVWNRTDTTLGSNSSVSNPYGYGVQISQSLFSGFRTVNSVAAAQAGIYASRETLRNAEQNTLLNTAIAYADVLQAREILTLRERNIAFLNEQVRSSQARLDVGEGTRTDLEQSRANLALARAQLEAARAVLGQAEAVFQQLTGLSAGQLTWSTGPERLYPRSQAEAVAIAMSEHPAIRASLYLVDAQVFNVKVAEGAFLPSLVLNGEVNDRFNASTFNRSTSAQATLRLTVPIYQGGQASSQVRQSQEVLGQRRIEVDQTRDQVKAQVISAWTALMAARANLAANVTRENAARLALEGVIEERNVGQRTQLDVLNAQSLLLSAQEVIVGARRDRLAAGYQLVAAIGRLNSRRLGLHVDHYVPREHTDAVADKWYGLRTPSGRGSPKVP